jgi:DNA modification methylase
MPISKGRIAWDKKCKNDWDDNFSDGELAWTSFNRPLKIFRHLYMGLMKENVDEINRVHPTQKPVRLMEWILKNYSESTDLILDPFLGSGTTAVAAKQLGRKFIGIEISQKYCDIAVQRLQQEILI